MKRIAKIKLVPAETIVAGQKYVGCLHGDKHQPSKRSIVVVCEDQSWDNEDKTDADVFDCRFENGNTYPYLKNELFVFVAEYDVPSLANPRKSVGTNTIELDWSDYKSMLTNVIVDTPNRVEVAIDFDNNKARVMTNEKLFSVKEVIVLLESMKTTKGETHTLGESITSGFADKIIENQIVELKKKYLW